MAPTLPNEHVLDRLKKLGNWRVEKAQTVALEGESDQISGSLLLTLGLRESGLENILNPDGTDRGCFQISDRYHAEWLDDEKGCPDGSWDPEPGRTALEEGYVPRFTPACYYARDKLRGGIYAAARLGVPPSLRLRFSLAAYNAGVTGAWRGWREHNNPDANTTGGDYSAWCIAHRTTVNQELHRHLPNWVIE